MWGAGCVCLRVSPWLRRAGGGECGGLTAVATQEATASSRYSSRGFSADGDFVPQGHPQLSQLGERHWHVVRRGEGCSTSRSTQDTAPRYQSDLAHRPVGRGWRRCHLLLLSLIGREGPVRGAEGGPGLCPFPERSSALGLVSEPHFFMSPLSLGFFFFNCGEMPMTEALSP